MCYFAMLFLHSLTVHASVRANSVSHGANAHDAVTGWGPRQWPIWSTGRDRWGIAPEMTTGRTSSSRLCRQLAHALDARVLRDEQLDRIRLNLKLEQVHQNKTQLVGLLETFPLR